MPNEGTGLQATPGNPGGTTDDARASVAHDLVQQLRSDYRQRDDEIAGLEQVIFQEDEIAIPKAYETTAGAPIHTPLALHMVNSAAAALSVNPPTVQFNPVGRGTAGEENATKREHFFEASWRRQEDESRRQLFRLFMWSLVAYGEGVLKTLPRKKTAWAQYAAKSRALRRKLDSGEGDYAGLDQDAKDRVYGDKTEQYKQAAPYPIVTTDVPVASFYPLRTVDGFSAVVEMSEVPYYDALERFSAGLTSRGDVVAPLRDDKGRIVPEAVGLPREQWAQAMADSKTKRLTLVEVWTCEEVVYILHGPNQGGGKSGPLGKGTLVKSMPHTFGDRYTRTLRGPYFSARGTTTASRDPHKASGGILFGFRELFPELNRLMSVQANAAWLTGFPAFREVAKPNGTDVPNPYGEDDPAAGKARTITPGMIYPSDIQPVEMPRSGIELGNYQTQLRQLVDMALPSVLQGLQSTDDSGYAVNQKVHLARLQFDPMVANAEDALQQRVGFESWLIERDIKERVYAWGATPTPGQERKTGRGSWLSIHPDDLDGVHTYTVHLDPETPSNKLLEQRYWEAMVKAGFASTPQAIEAMGGNVDEVEEQQLLWEIKRDPAVRQALKARIFATLGTLDQKALMGGPGQPDLTSMVPNGAPPGMAGAPGGPGMGQPGDAVGNVMAPGMGMPLVPPPGAAAAGPVRGMLPGTPVSPAPPPGHIALPGERP